MNSPSGIEHAPVVLFRSSYLCYDFSRRRHQHVDAAEVVWSRRCKLFLNRYGAGKRSNRLSLPRSEVGWRGFFGHLERIDLSDQGLSGDLPPGLARLALEGGRLRELDLTLNRFRGRYPRALARATFAGCAVALDEHSRLTAEDLADLEAVSVVDLSSAALSNELVALGPTWSAVVRLDLSYRPAQIRTATSRPHDRTPRRRRRRYNALDGPLPDLSELVALEALKLNNNRFSGELEGFSGVDFAAGLGEKLKLLHLQNNLLTGELPNGILALRYGGADVSFAGNRGFSLRPDVGFMLARLDALPETIDLSASSLRGPRRPAFESTPRRRRDSFLISTQVTGVAASAAADRPRSSLGRKPLRRAPRRGRLAGDRRSRRAGHGAPRRRRGLRALSELEEKRLRRRRPSRGELDPTTRRRRRRRARPDQFSWRGAARAPRRRRGARPPACGVGATALPDV